MQVAKPLEGKVALVAGATRGAGRGIAVALGEAGATVWCTGRSSRGQVPPAPERAPRPETIEETAELVTRAGGRGIAVRCDHLDEAQVIALFERVRRESGKLDVLVNDIWGGDELAEWGKPFWEADVQKGLRMMRTAIDTHLITSRHGVPLMVEKGAGLVVEVTDGDTARYRGTYYYDLVKNAIIRMANAMHEELRPRGVTAATEGSEDQAASPAAERRGVTALAITPGFLRSEAMLDLFGVKESNWRDAAKKVPDFIASETPLFVGRAVAALAADPDVAKKGGRVWASWTLSDEYGFTDADGARPHWGRHWQKTYGARWYKPVDDTFYSYLGGRDEMPPIPDVPQ